MVTIAGVTPAGYNGVWPVVSVPTTTTFTIQTGTTLLGPITVQGTVVATAYGITGTPSRFFEFVSETLASDMGRIESKALRNNNRTIRADRFAVYEKGVGGDITFEVMSKGFAYFLDCMFGTTVTTGPADTAAYTHTAAVLSTTRGKSLTIQKLVPMSSGGAQPITYSGMKVTGWELSNDVDGILMLKLSHDGRQSSTSVATAAVSYPTAQELLTFVGGTVTIDGVVVANVRKASVKGDLKLNTSRRFIGPTALQAEPIEAGMSDIGASLDVEFLDMTLDRKSVV